jgi:hypothetical protein
LDVFLLLFNFFKKAYQKVLTKQPSAIVNFERKNFQSYYANLISTISFPHYSSRTNKKTGFSNLLPG